MEKEKHLMSDEDMEKVGGGHTVKGGREICDQFEPMQPDYYLSEYHCKDCVHYVKTSDFIDLGKCDVR